MVVCASLFTVDNWIWAFFPCSFSRCFLSDHWIQWIATAQQKAGGSLVLRVVIFIFDMHCRLARALQHGSVETPVSASEYCAPIFLAKP